MTELVSVPAVWPARRSHVPTTTERNKAGGPWIVVVALAFCIVLGGVTAAALLICGWGEVESVEIGWWDVTITCKEPKEAG